MPIFLAAVAGLLILAAVLSHKLAHPADKLGLHAARAEIVAEINRSVRWNRNDAAMRHHIEKAEQFAQAYGVRSLAVVYARSLVGEP